MWFERPGAALTRVYRGGITVLGLRGCGVPRADWRWRGLADVRAATAPCAAVVETPHVASLGRHARRRDTPLRSPSTIAAPRCPRNELHSQLRGRVPGAARRFRFRAGARGAAVHFAAADLLFQRRRAAHTRCHALRTALRPIVTPRLRPADGIGTEPHDHEQPGGIVTAKY